MISLCIAASLLWFYWTLLLKVWQDAMELTSEKNNYTKRLEFLFIKVATMLMFTGKKITDEPSVTQKSCNVFKNLLLEHIHPSIYSQMPRINCLDEFFGRTCYSNMQNTNPFVKNVHILDAWEEGGNMGGEYKSLKTPLIYPLKVVPLNFKHECLPPTASVAGYFWSEVFDS